MWQTQFVRRFTYSVQKQGPATFCYKSVVFLKHLAAPLLCGLRRHLAVGEIQTSIGVAVQKYFEKSKSRNTSRFSLFDMFFNIWCNSIVFDYWVDFSVALPDSPDLLYSCMHAHYTFMRVCIYIYIYICILNKFTQRERDSEREVC